MTELPSYLCKSTQKSSLRPNPPLETIETLELTCQHGNTSLHPKEIARSENFDENQNFDQKIVPRAKEDEIRRWIAELPSTRSAKASKSKKNRSGNSRSPKIALSEEREEEGCK